MDEAIEFIPFLLKRSRNSLLISLGVLHINCLPSSENVWLIFYYLFSCFRENEVNRPILDLKNFWSSNFVAGTQTHLKKNTFLSQLQLVSYPNPTPGVAATINIYLFSDTLATNYFALHSSQPNVSWEEVVHRKPSSPFWFIKSCSLQIVNCVSNSINQTYLSIQFNKSKKKIFEFI